VSKIYVVIVAVESVSEGQRVVLFVRETVAVHLVTDLVLVVPDVGADAVPTSLVFLE
jgi:hypothetical protein